MVIGGREEPLDNKIDPAKWQSDCVFYARTFQFPKSQYCDKPYIHSVHDVPYMVLASKMSTVFIQWEVTWLVNDVIAVGSVVCLLTTQERSNWVKCAKTRWKQANIHVATKSQVFQTTKQLSDVIKKCQMPNQVHQRDCKQAIPVQHYNWAVQLLCFKIQLSKNNPSREISTWS